MQAKWKIIFSVSIFKPRNIFISLSNISLNKFLSESLYSIYLNLFWYLTFFFWFFYHQNSCTLQSIEYCLQVSVTERNSAWLQLLIGGRLRGQSCAGLRPISYPYLYVRLYYRHQTLFYILLQYQLPVWRLTS